MTTLADMTPQERAQCRGMWCVDKHGPLCIYMGDDQVWEELGICTYPASAIAMRAKLENLIPRPNLPRAWTMEGEPPAGEWQTAKAKIALNENAKYDPEQNVITAEWIADPDHEPRSSHDIRRWIGDWETIEEEQA